MTRWYRAYIGTVKDDKLAEIAVMVGCSRSVAISAWHAILESAAETNDSGRFDTTPRRVAATLAETLATLQAVFDAMSEIGMIENGAVSAWSKRQYESDSSTERSRKHREAKKNGKSPSRNADATLQGRRATPPDTEAETDTEAEEKESTGKPAASFSAGRPLFSKFEIEDFERRCCEASGKIELGSFEIVEQFLQRGILDIEDHILPLIRRRSGQNWRSWAYLSQPLEELEIAEEAAQRGSRPARNPKVFIRVDSPQWQAWTAHNGKPFPTGKDGNGWHVDTEWPPGYQLAEAAE